MTQVRGNPGTRRAGVPSSLRSNIIACVNQDEGASLICGDCGHQFLESKPLSDESHPLDNITLAKAIYYHMCVLGRRGA